MTDHVVDQGFERTPDQLVASVYRECRLIATRLMRREKSRDDYDSDDLTHDSIITLLNVGSRTSIQDGRHLLALFSRIARRRLIDRAREYRASKRGSGNDSVSLNEFEDTLCSDSSSELMIIIDEALQRLSKCDERQTTIVELKYFGGLSEEEIADTLGITARTVRRDLAVAKAYLSQLLCQKKFRDSTGYAIELAA